MIGKVLDRIATLLLRTVLVSTEILVADSSSSVSASADCFGDGRRPASVTLCTLTDGDVLTHLRSIPATDPNAPRKRRSRWGDAKTELPGLPTAINANGVSQAHLDNYAIHLRLEEINRKLRLNDFVPPERER